VYRMVMMRHPSDPGNLGFRMETFRLSENRFELFVRALDVAVTAMQVHRDISGIQEAGAWALSPWLKC
jgi:hypothetical protein